MEAFLALKAANASHLCLVTPSSLLQKVGCLESLVDKTVLCVGGKVARAELLDQLNGWGFQRQELVREPGDYAVRGSLVDLFPGGAASALRLDFLGDVLESVKPFDPLSQRTLGVFQETVSLGPLSEVLLTPQSIQRFRKGYRTLFPSAREGDDPLYTAVSQGHPYPGMEHWLPLFQDALVPLWEALSPRMLSLGTNVTPLLHTLENRITQSYATRQSLVGKGPIPAYQPLPPDALYVETASLSRWAGGIKTVEIVPSPVPAVPLDPLPQRLLLTARSMGGLERLKAWAQEKERSFQQVASWDAFQALPERVVGLCVLPLTHGFQEPKGQKGSLLTEGDLFGDRPTRPVGRARDAQRALQSLGVFQKGDYVVHEDHGIGRYEGLEGVPVNGVVHDCLHVTYAGEDKLYVPAENMNLISRYGPGDVSVALDKLGMPQWQNRKARIKKRIQIAAESLLKIAAQRLTEKGPVCHDLSPQGQFEAFCAKFPYPETEDQLKAVEEILEDLAGDVPMDRLICGDVGFGKTEIALRAAYLLVASGYQLAVIVPTTLLARQHFKNFQKRFADTPFEVALVSRLVAPKEVERIYQRLETGQVHIVISTHSLLRRAPAFARLGLVIVDEEQHFGVAQKEKLKQLTPNVHVLSLSATPIPRTLQMALLGVRQMSTITTPPLGRMAVQTFSMPWDPLTVQQAIEREQKRGGQVFYVCPRIEALESQKRLLEGLLPHLRVGVAHGQMPARQLEEIMWGVEEGRFDVLLSTNIVESGLDISTANTLIVHRADLLGLGQLYQLRGRVGRGNIQGYAYFTYLPQGHLSPTAQKRLEVMQSLDYLGAGFAVASHDAEIRGVGNLVGEEQSGHMREVGVELYQHMLEDAITQLKAGASGAPVPPSLDWTPQIHFPHPCRIPDSYVEDVNVRLSLYQALSVLKTTEDVQDFRAELVDRFGPLPPDVVNILQVVTFKVLCLRAGIDKLDIGQKGAVMSFRHACAPNPETLVAVLAQGTFPCRLSPDHKVRFLGEVATASGLKHLQAFLGALGASQKCFLAPTER
jgi:transcription-repair coupling factor (superfamily II helicase)